MIKFIHTSDIHLGAKFSQFEDKNKRESEQLETFDRIIEYSQKKEVDFFLVSGDLFNSISPPKKYIELVKKAVNSLLDSGIRVFIIPGNHDYYVPDGIWDRELNFDSKNFYVFKNSDFEVREVAELGVNVIGKDYNKSEKNKRLIKRENIPDIDGVNILMFHGSYDYPDFKEFEDFPFSLSELETVNFNYMALGHYHRFGIVMDTPKKKAVYPGSPEAMKFSSRETGKRNIIYGEIESNSNLKIEPVEIQSAVLETIELDITPFENIGMIEEKIRKIDNKNKYLNCVLKGTSCFEVYKNLDKLSDRFSGVFSSFNLDYNKVNIPEDVSADDRYIIGRFISRIREKIDSSDSEDQKNRYRLALRIVFNKINQ